VGSVGGEERSSDSSGESMLHCWHCVAMCVVLVLSGWVRTFLSFFRLYTPMRCFFLPQSMYTHKNCHHLNFECSSQRKKNICFLRLSGRWKAVQ
jgi:UPF0716 family protein affecting phage T7 exclusion